jgi:hypothetical protein
MSYNFRLLVSQLALKHRRMPHGYMWHKNDKAKD